MGCVIDVPQDEKNAYGGDKSDVPPKNELDYEEDDEDMDALIEELESEDAGADFEEEEAAAQPGGARIVPEELLNTDTRTGLNDSEVSARRKKYGLNQMKGAFPVPAGESLLRANGRQRRRRT